MSQKNTLYDNLRNPVSTIERGQQIPSGLNKLSVHVWIVNDAGKYLLQQRMGTAKKFPNMWGQTGGGAIAGESSWDACVRETMEELGLTPDPEKSVLVGTIKRPMDFVDVWLVHSNAKISDLKVTINTKINAASKDSFNKFKYLIFIFNHSFHYKSYRVYHLRYTLYRFTLIRYYYFLHSQFCFLLSLTQLLPLIRLARE